MSVHVENCVMVYRKAMDEKYHFGCQFTADLIAMNTAGEPAVGIANS